MAILDKEPADQSGQRWFGELEGSDGIAIQYGNPNGSGSQLPNGQTVAILSISALKDLVSGLSAPVADPNQVQSETAENPPGLFPTP